MIATGFGNGVTEVKFDTKETSPVKRVFTKLDKEDQDIPTYIRKDRKDYGDKEVIRLGMITPDFGEDEDEYDIPAFMRREVR